MNANASRTVFSLGVALAMAACLGIARSSSTRKSSTKSFEVKLYSAAKLNDGEELKAGDYQMMVSTDAQTRRSSSTGMQSSSPRRKPE